MQWKMARPSRFADGFNRWALRHGFPLLLKVAPRMPRWLNLLGARFVITVVMGFYHPPKRAIARNLSRVLGLPAGSRRVRAAVRRMLYNFACYWVDLFRFAQLPTERAMALVESATGHDRVEAALAQGKGAILLTAHLGNWELGGVFLRFLGQRVAIVYVPDQFEDVERCRKMLRQATGVDEIPIQPGDLFTSLPALRALRENRLLALQGDRDFNDRGVWIDFFGVPAPFPVGPFTIAAITGAPLLPSFITYTTGQRFVVEIGEPIRVENTGNRDADVRRALEQWVAVLEAAVRRWPTQWYTFYDFWQKERAPSPTARPEAGSSNQTASGPSEKAG